MARFKKNKKSETTFVKVTGLFQSRNKKGMYVGTAKPEYLEPLAEKLEQALDTGKGLVFVVWRNKFEDGPYFNLTVDVARDQENTARSAKSRKKIEDDDEEPEEEEEEVDL